MVEMVGGGCFKSLSVKVTPLAYWLRALVTSSATAVRPRGTEEGLAAPVGEYKSRERGEMHLPRPTTTTLLFFIYMALKDSGVVCQLQEEVVSVMSRQMIYTNGA